MYPPKEEGDNYTFPLYVQIDNRVRCFMLSGKQSQLSNEPGITRLFGRELEGSAYMMYPINRNGAKKFEADLKQSTFNVIKMFVYDTYWEGEQDHKSIINGDWILRRLKSGSWLFWKPYYTLYTKDVAMPTEVVKDSEVKTMKNEFEMFMPTVNGYDFKGVVAAAGTWTDKGGWTLTMGNEIIEKIYTQLKGKVNQTVIDWDHDDNYVGTLIRAELSQRFAKKYIEVEGVMPTAVPDEAGLSLTVNSKALWDKKHNTWVVIGVDVIGFSIITQGKPACTVCMIR